MLGDLVAVMMELLPDAGVEPDDVRSGLAGIQYALGRLGLEAAQADSENLPAIEAVQQPGRFPLMHRVHLGVMDILTVELPPELADWARRLLRMSDSPLFESFRLQLARCACDPRTSPPERSLAQFLLFEAVRLNLLVMTWRSRRELFRGGLDEGALDRSAQDQVGWLLRHPKLLAGPTPMRPLHLLVVGSFGQLVEMARTALRGVSAHVETTLTARAELEAALAEANAADAVLIRNAFAPAWGEQRLSVERLSSDHPLVLGDAPRDRLDQRLRRRMMALESKRTLPPRRRPALIDILSEEER